MSGVVNFENITLTKKLPLKNKIIMYSGNDLPDGYVWCDGNHGTPDLRDRFIYGINNSGSIGAIGTSEINYIPSHNHSIQSYSFENKQINATTNNINYKFVNQTNNYPASHTANRGNHGGTTFKNHDHEIQNTQNNERLSNVVEVSINDSNNNQANNVYNSIQNTNTPNSNIFNQKYIYIGFIMKI